MTPSLAIIQARIKSHRLERKMLLPLGGTTVLGYAWRTAVEFFGRAHVVIACPDTDYNTFLTALPKANVFRYDGKEGDVLGRLHACAHYFLDDPTDVIYRLTPDDVPLDLLRERFTLAWLDHQHATVEEPFYREHIGYLLSHPHRIEINTAEDYQAACRRVGGPLPNCGVTGDISDVQMGELQWRQDPEC